MKEKSGIKNSSKLAINFILIVSLLFCINCSGTRKIIIYPKNGVGLSQINFEKKKSYEIISKNQKEPVKANGKQILLQDSQIKISKNNIVTQVYDEGQIIMIYEKDKRKLKRMLVGAGIGASLGIGLTLIPATKDCSASTGDPGDCRDLRKLFWGLVPVSAIVFGLAGMGVGAILTPSTNENKK